MMQSTKHHRANMRSQFQSKTIYVIYFGVKLIILLLFVLVSFHFFSEYESKWILISRLFSSTRDNRNSFKPKINEDQQVSYPWIAGDPTCQHFSVKVKLIK